MTGRATLIECYGLPGTGKTTLCVHLGQKLGQLTSDEVRASWRGERRLGERLRFASHALLEPRVWLAVGVATLRLGIWKSPDGVRRMATLPLLRARTGIFLERHALALDQLLMQELWSALVSAGNYTPDSGALASLLGALYERLPVRLLCLDLDSGRAAERIASRTGGLSRFDGLPAETIAEKLRPAEALIKTISEAAERTGLTVHRLDAGRESKDLVGDTIEALEGRAR
jgi:hypothetical protein